MDEAVDNAVADVVRELLNHGVRSGDSITIDLQESGEHPYRVVVPEEQLPLIGLATTPRLSDLIPGITPDGAE